MRVAGEHGILHGVELKNILQFLLSVLQLSHTENTGIAMAYKRKTEDEYVIQADYGFGDGFEDVTVETTR